MFIIQTTIGKKCLSNLKNSMPLATENFNFFSINTYEEIQFLSLLNLNRTSQIICLIEKQHLLQGNKLLGLNLQEL